MTTTNVTTYRDLAARLRLLRDNGVDRSDEADRVVDDLYDAWWALTEAERLEEHKLAAARRAEAARAASPLPDAEVLYARVVAHRGAATVGLLTADDVAEFVTGISWGLRACHRANVDPRLLYGHRMGRGNGRTRDVVSWRSTGQAFKEANGSIGYGYDDGAFHVSRRMATGWHGSHDLGGFPFCGIPTKNAGVGRFGPLPRSDDATGWAMLDEALRADGWFVRGGRYRPPPPPAESMPRGTRIAGPAKRTDFPRRGARGVETAEQREARAQERRQRQVQWYVDNGLEVADFIKEGRQLRPGERAIVPGPDGKPRLIHRDATHHHSRPARPDELRAVGAASGTAATVGPFYDVDEGRVVDDAVVIDREPVDDDDDSGRDPDDPAPWAGDANDGTEGAA